MTSIEELLVRDIATVTGGVVVTDSDLQVARVGLAERVEGTRRRGRRRTVALTAAAAVVLGAGGATALLTLGGDEKALQPAGSGPGTIDPHASYLIGSTPTPRLVAGVWRVDNEGIAVKFDENGTVRIDNHGTLFSRPATTGTYVIDGELITVTTTADAEADCIGTKIVMRASIPEPGAMRFVRTDEIGACSPMPPGTGALEKLLPIGPSMAGLIFSKDTDWRPLSDKAVLPGIWLAEGGGHLLELDADGAYFVADDSGAAIDRGVWSFSEANLTLTSSGLSTACSQGDTLVLGSVEHENPGTAALRGTVKKNTCGAAWTPAAWFLIPHVGS